MGLRIAADVAGSSSSRSPAPRPSSLPPRGSAARPDAAQREVCPPEHPSRPRPSFAPAAPVVRAWQGPASPMARGRVGSVPRRRRPTRGARGGGTGAARPRRAARPSWCPAPSSSTRRPWRGRWTASQRSPVTNGGKRSTTGSRPRAATRSVRPRVSAASSSSHSSTAARCASSWWSSPRTPGRRPPPDGRRPARRPPPRSARPPHGTTHHRGAEGTAGGSPSRQAAPALPPAGIVTSATPVRSTVPRARPAQHTWAAVPSTARTPTRPSVRLWHLGAAAVTARGARERPVPTATLAPVAV